MILNSVPRALLSPGLEQRVQLTRTEVRMTVSSLCLPSITLCGSALPFDVHEVVQAPYAAKSRARISTEHTAICQR